MFAVCPITSLPAFRNGGANGGRGSAPSMNRIIAGTPPLASPARDVEVVGARLFQRQADEFAAALDRRPVVELVAHLSAPMVQQ